MSRRSVTAAIGTALLLEAAAAGDAVAATGLTILKRDLCHSFKLDCRSVPAARRTPRPAPKPKPPHEAARPRMPAPVAPAAAPSAPLPRAKPSEAPPARPSEASAPPFPRQKSSSLLRPAPATSAAVTTAEPPDRDGEAAASGASTASIPPPPPASAPPGPSTCVENLRRSKVRFEVMPATFGAAACPLADPVRLQAVETPSGTVTFPEGPVFNCRFAQKFAQWVSDTGAPVVLAQTSKRLESMATGPGYECRRRNGDSSAKMSEHAAGDAVDITSMTIAGGTAVRMADAINPASPSYALLRALRTSACGYFTTVLGPGANEAHREHYHFDLGVHGKSANYRICE